MRQANCRRKHASHKSTTIHADKQHADGESPSGACWHLPRAACSFPRKTACVSLVPWHSQPPGPHILQAPDQCSDQKFELSESKSWRPGKILKRSKVLCYRKNGHYASRVIIFDARGREVLRLCKIRWLFGCLCLHTVAEVC